MINTFNSTLAFIRIHFSKSPKCVKEKCYTALVRPITEYAGAVWDPHYKNHIEEIEKIQKKSRKIRHRELKNGNRKFRI